VLGAHIEMTDRPGVLVADEAPSHPHERVLELPASDFTELQAAMGDTPREEVHRDFFIFPEPPRPLPPDSPPQ
jgi:hydroxyacylglutathione hydrolase